MRDDLSSRTVSFPIILMATRNRSVACDDCRFIGTKEHSLESLGLSAQRSRKDLNTSKRFSEILRFAQNDKRLRMTSPGNVQKDTSLVILNKFLPCHPERQRGIGALLATSVRNSSTDCDDCRFIGTKEHSLESLGLSAQRSHIEGAQHQQGLLEILRFAQNDKKAQNDSTGKNRVIQIANTKPITKYD